jgi:demethoxyubiquinone hydroxylase (CLK1/Coq7/Cat5 family)
VADIISLGAGLGSIVLGEARALSLVQSIEETIQEEEDEMLRVLNEHKVDNKEARKPIIKARDEVFEFYQGKESSESVGLNHGVKVATSILLRLARVI